MKIFKSFTFFIFLSFIFTILEYGRFSLVPLEFIHPIFFACSATAIFLNNKLKRYILGFSLILLFSMIILYLFDLLLLSNWVGSLGMGMFVILIFSYISELIKKGYIERY